MNAKDTVVVGDRLRFSTELLKQIHEQPFDWSELVCVVEIRTDYDGAKILLLNRVPVSAERTETT